MLTHPHNDHVGGLPAVVSSVDVERAVGTRYPHTSWSYRRYVDCLQDRQVEWKRVLEGDVIWVGEAMLHVLYPRESDLEAVRSKPQLGLNTVSIVARLCYGDFAMLLAGDAEELTERALLSRGLPLRADVLKVGHHGANTSSSAPFLRAVGADAAIISAGACNRFGHPHADALRRLRRAGCRIYRTDLHGAVTVTSDGRTYRIRTTRPVDLGAAGRQ
jgi:competence protein ComEC